MPARQGGARRSVLLVTYLEQLKGAPRALIDAFSANNRGGDERSTSPTLHARHLASFEYSF
ncbi:hypothetical protein A9E74_02077 [Methylophaga muralis]|uniref:Uncharacterized protein n=1 Tax=Methylophaga muralis TaxID=291169 RepID=A0A1E3GQ97_9GAMM|nr:hypothetical protein A9E74_02077 [Methylophaga muralis]